MPDPEEILQLCCVTKMLRMYYLNVIPVSQLANIKAAQGSKIERPEIIFVNTLSLLDSQRSGIYAHPETGLSTKMDFFAQVSTRCEQVLFEKIIPQYFGSLNPTTDWHSGGKKEINP